MGETHIATYSVLLSKVANFRRAEKRSDVSFIFLDSQFHLCEILSQSKHKDIEFF